MAITALVRGRIEDESNSSFSVVKLSVFFVQICSQPILGYFSADQTLDFMLQAQTGNGKKKVKQEAAERAVAT